MSEPVKIICPLCYSAALNMYMEGLSSSSAGIMSMPAGNIASNNMELKCNACGHIFKPVEGKLSQEADGAAHTYATTGMETGATIPINTNAPDPKAVINMAQTQGKLQAIKFVKDNTGWSLKQAKDYVDALDKGHTLPGKKTGCFIATACYGDYDAPEVLYLRLYRDHILAATLPGKLFIRMYYFFSPPLAQWLSRAPLRQALVRNHILRPLLRMVRKSIGDW